MIRGKTIKKPNELKISLEASIHNRFDIEVIDSKTGKVKQKAEAFNVICQKLWDRLAVGESYFSYIHFGTGNGAPSQSDTSLFTFLGSKNVESVSNEKGIAFSFSRETGIFSAKRSIKILENEYVGSTLTEVGIAYGSSKTNLCTHAMLQDMNGNKISIEKTETDIINIYATIFVHVNPFGYDNGSMFFDIVYGTYSDWNSFMHFFAGLSNRLGSYYNGRAFFYSSLLDSSKNREVVSASSITFDAATKKYTTVYNRLPAANGNFANGILRVCAGVYANASFGTDTLPLMCLNINENSQWFSYSEIENEAVGTGDGVTKDFALRFPFARDAEIFVDGVKVENCTVEYGPNAVDFLPFVERLLSCSTAEHHVYDFLKANHYSAGSTAYYYNPMHEVGIGFVRVYYTSDIVEVEASNDFASWEFVMNCGDNKNYEFAVPVKYQKYKYWRFKDVKGTSSTYLPDGLKPPSSYTGKVLHFVNPPAAGSVITANYKSKCIAKDENNVFDLTIEMQLGEYTG